MSLTCDMHKAALPCALCARVQSMPFRPTHYLMHVQTGQVCDALMGLSHLPYGTSFYTEEAWCDNATDRRLTREMIERDLPSFKLVDFAAGEYLRRAADRVVREIADRVVAATLERFPTPSPPPAVPPAVDRSSAVVRLAAALGRVLGCANGICVDRRPGYFIEEDVDRFEQARQEGWALLEELKNEVFDARWPNAVRGKGGV